MTGRAAHEERLRVFSATLGPHARVKVANGRVVAYCALCRGAAYVDRSADNVRDAWREHEAAPKHQRKTASDTEWTGSR